LAFSFKKAAYGDDGAALANDATANTKPSKTARRRARCERSSMIEREGGRRWQRQAAATQQRRRRRRKRRDDLEGSQEASYFASFCFSSFSFVAAALVQLS